MSDSPHKGLIMHEMCPCHDNWRASSAGRVSILVWPVASELYTRDVAYCFIVSYAVVLIQV